MNEDEAFIRAIVDAPGDDLPRLVYADWLDDRADPRGPYLRAEHEPAPAAIQRLVLRLSRLPGAAKLSLGVRTGDLATLGRRAPAVAESRSGPMKSDLHVH